MRRGVFALALGLSTLAASTPSDAVVIEPDGTIRPSADGEDYWNYVGLEWVDWHGEVLASRTTPFEARVHGEEAGRDLWVRGTVLHEVIRETQSGYLSFHYRVDVNGTSGDVTDFEGATIYDFGHYFTDVRADVSSNELPFLSRQDTLTFGNFIYYLNVESLDHWVVVRTDAPMFAEGGTLRLSFDFDGWGEDARTGVPTFRPVPEPGASAAVLFTAAAALLRRRPRAAVVPPRSANR